MLQYHLCVFNEPIAPHPPRIAQQMTKDFKPDPTEKLYTFDDVQGVDEAKSEVEEIVDFLRNPEKFQRLGAKLPTGSQSDCVVSLLYCTSN